ncbi:MAG: hypothetical protein JXR07_18450 [Reichenbachiella sp.]
MDTTNDFISYLASKKINAQDFRKAEEKLYKEWEEIFANVNPASFTAQKLFLINPLRRKYLLKEEIAVQAKPKMAARPKFKKP